MPEHNRKMSRGEEVAQDEEGGLKSLSKGAKVSWKENGTVRNDEVFEQYKTQSREG